MEKEKFLEIFAQLEPHEIGKMLGRSLLSDTAIKRHLDLGNIVIDPFDSQNLGNASCDVTLGMWYFREQKPKNGPTIYNPYSEKDVERVWGKAKQAEPVRDWTEGTYIRDLRGIDPDEFVILIHPGETLLCHTNEFIGGAGGIVTTMMKARSSMGRNFIEICKCAGWGDVGFINRWTMELTNNSQFYTIPLIVGRRVAQITFFEVEPTEVTYGKVGKYQTGSTLDEVKKSWEPEAMLPHMFADRESKVADSRRLLGKKI